MFVICLSIRFETFSSLACFACLSSSPVPIKLSVSLILSSYSLKVVCYTRISSVELFSFKTRLHFTITSQDLLFENLSFSCHIHTRPLNLSLSHITCACVKHRLPLISCYTRITHLVAWYYGAVYFTCSLQFNSYNENLFVPSQPRCVFVLLKTLQ
jgi:hypothetical protein